MNRLRKEINKSFSKEMSNIYLKVTAEKNCLLKTSVFRLKKFVTRSIFWELQLMQISLNLKTSFCNIKIRGLGAELYVTSLLF